MCAVSAVCAIRAVGAVRTVGAVRPVGPTETALAALSAWKVVVKPRDLVMSCPVKPNA